MTPIRQSRALPDGLDRRGRSVPARPAWQPTLLALAAAVLALPTARAEDPATPNETSLSVGAGALIGDAADQASFGQYNGLRPDRPLVGLLGIDLRRLDEDTDTRFALQGTRLLGNTRALELLWQRQGQWRLKASVAESVRYDPMSVHTANTGLGGTTPQVQLLPAGGGRDTELKLERRALGLGLATWIGQHWQLELDLKAEDKEGSRLFGVGVSCPSPAAPGCGRPTGIATGWALLFLPEPIRSSHTQIEARASYAHDGLRLSAGYYGSLYQNRHGALTPQVPTALNNALGQPLPLATGLQALLMQPLALPPDNQAHQLDLSGQLDLSATTRASFKLAFGRASQNADFAAAGLGGAPAGVGNLGARVDSTLAQLGLSMRPAPAWALQADLRWQDRDDKTPLAYYSVGPNLRSTNQRLPDTRWRGRLEAGWRFAEGYKATVGLEAEAIDRGAYTATSAYSGVSALRQKTDETTLRAELRRTLHETLTGALTLSHSRRGGSNWLKPNAGNGTTEVSDPSDPAQAFALGSVFMPTVADRNRDKARLVADWTPTEALAVQFSAEQGRDRFDTPGTHGLDRSRMGAWGVDWTVAVNERWSVNGSASLSSQGLRQTRFAGYAMAWDNRSGQLGFGVNGRLSSTWSVGGSVSMADDRSTYRQGLDTYAGADSAALLAATGGLPDVVWRQQVLKLNATYTVDKKQSVRLDLWHQRTRQSDWTWGYNGVPFAYSDGSTLWQAARQEVGYLAVTYTIRWN